MAADPRDASIAGGVRSFSYQDYYPGSDLELEQGEGLESLPESILALMRSPMVGRADGAGPELKNGNEASFFAFVVGNTQAVQALIGNQRRSYLIIQNQGPGSIWFNFTNVAVVGQCLFLPSGAIYEPQATGPNGTYVPPRSSVWMIADLANTVVAVCEGSWMPF
jgi:hypothetical protein